MRVHPVSLIDLLTKTEFRADNTASRATYSSSAESRSDWATAGELKHDEGRKRGESERVLGGMEFVKGAL